MDTGGYEADIPDNSGYLLLASPGKNANYSLFDCEIEDSSNLSNVYSVSDALYEIIDSGKDYPPALAIAREKIEEESEKHTGNISKQEFLDLYKSILEDLLKNQINQKFFLCKAIQTESGYLYSGGYYWIVGYSTNDEQILWVSRDYQLYRNHLSYFDVDKKLLVQRFASV